jgi:two-component system LytT family response regulator
MTDRSPTRIRALIVDDEAPGRLRIRQFLKDQPDFEITGEFANGRDALQAILKLKPGLVFLDVQMTGMSGIEVCQAIPEAGGTLPLVIFVTAYDKYAVKAFDVHAVDYLLKPFDHERFEKALSRARERAATPGDESARIREMLSDLLPGGHKPNRIVIKEDGRLVFLAASSIDWVEADGNYVRIHAGAASHYIRETLSAIEAQLPSAEFARISRSALVNLDRIKEMQPLFYGDYVVILHNGCKLNLSRNYRPKLESVLGQK